MINGQFSLDWIPAQVTGCDTKNRVMWLALWTSMNQINPALVSHTFIEREAFNAVAGFDEKLDWEEDWDLWLRMREKFGAEAFAGMRERVCYYWIDEAERAKKKRRHEVTIEDGTEIDVHEYLRRRHPGVDPAK